MRSKWMMAGALAAVLAASVGVGARQQQSTGTRREAQFENDHVRVWKSIIMPNQPLSVHRHDHGRTIVVPKAEPWT